MISSWEGFYADLRRPRSKDSQSAKTEVPVPDEAAAALRGLRLLDTDCERMVYAARAGHEGGGALLDVDADDLDELMGRRRQKALDDAFAVLSEALRALEEH